MGPRARARGNESVGFGDLSARVASMGPRARARGNRFGGDLQLFVNAASMGPRARARGNEQCCDLGGGCIGASMGPRARARGNAAGIAELRCKRCGLQWGHERALVEIQTTRARDTRAMCFNGATSARSWK